MWTLIFIILAAINIKAKTINAFNALSNDVTGTTNNETEEDTVDKISFPGIIPNLNNVENTSEVPHPYCDYLREMYSPNRNNLTVFVYGKPYKIRVKSTMRAPSRATAAIITIILKHVIGYNNVFTEIDNRDNCELATTLNAHFEKDDALIIHVDADWKGPEDKCPHLPGCSRKWQRSCSIAGPRLAPVGATPGVIVRLFAALRSNVKSTVCQNTYSQNNFKECGFVISTEHVITTVIRSESNTTGCIPLLITPDVKVPIELNLTDIDGIPLCQHRLNNRGELVRLLKYVANESMSHSFLESFFFIDYDFNEDNKIVRKVFIPREYTSDITALRVIDLKVFQQFVPQLVEVLNHTTPHSSELREIVDLNATIQDSEIATCAWAINHVHRFESWFKTSDVQPWVAVYLCIDDPDFEKYKTVLSYLKSFLYYEYESNYKIDLKYIMIDCTNKHNLSNELAISRAFSDWQWYVGAVASGEGVEAATDASKSIKTQMVLYDVTTMQAQLSDSVVSVTGSLSLLAEAIQYFFKKHGWHRIAIISERTSLAEDLTAELKKEKRNVYRVKHIDKEDIVTSIDKVLADLKESDARIVFINTGSKIADLIACKATEIGMTSVSKYVWIAREWRPEKCDNNLGIFLISYNWRGTGQGPDHIVKQYINKTIYSNLDKKFGQVWPPQAASLADAILLIAHRLTVTARTHPYLMYDYHEDVTTSIMANLTKNDPGIGVIQPLDLYNYTRANPHIYVNVWRKRKVKGPSIWRGISQSKEIIEIIKNSEIDTEAVPKDDGSKTSCVIPSGDPFTPSCDDAKWICGMFSLLLITLSLWGMKRWQANHIKRKEKDTLVRLLTRCERTASILSPYLVERSQLDLRDELGCGHYGRVRFGLLRRLNHKQKLTAIAAKALRKDAAPAEEAEFLREASFLAGLSHAHIIRFVGVCADSDGPPLLLMEHAFFGDLSRYLRARRHLAETNDEVFDFVCSGHEKQNSKCTDEEACYVSAEELTRLAYEAALALAYLNECHLLHRDVRAANCLVDAKRSLKLADFGMARRLGGNAQPHNLGEDLEPSSDYKYICRRRGVFPVPWMAPESLEKGEFSHASDVWALGVLILEIATLGARPFGVWRPLRVLRHVRNGGRPPLPIDVSYYTTEVAEMCWAKLPNRATAAEVSDYLRAHPAAIRPALRAAWPEPDASLHGSDSGVEDTHADHEWTYDLMVSTM